MEYDRFHLHGLTLEFTKLHRVYNLHMAENIMSQPDDIVTKTFIINIDNIQDTEFIPKYSHLKPYNYFLVIKQLFELIKLQSEHIHRNMATLFHLKDIKLGIPTKERKQYLDDIVRFEARFIVEETIKTIKNIEGDFNLILYLRYHNYQFKTNFDPKILLENPEILAMVAESKESLDTYYTLYIKPLFYTPFSDTHLNPCINFKYTTCLNRLYDGGKKLKDHLDDFCTFEFLYIILGEPTKYYIDVYYSFWVYYQNEREDSWVYYRNPLENPFLPVWDKFHIFLSKLILHKYNLAVNNYFKFENYVPFDPHKTKSSNWFEFIANMCDDRKKEVRKEHKVLCRTKTYYRFKVDNTGKIKARRVIEYEYTSAENPAWVNREEGYR